MIGKITGTVTDKHAEQLLVEVSGIGYLIHTTHPDTVVQEQTISFWTYLAVRENSLDLYGFSQKAERELFVQLLQIPKIGPKSALQILTKASFELIVECVQLQDAKRLAKTSGIGAKTAEKITAELVDKIIATHDREPVPHNPALQDIVDALVALGYSERDAYQAATHIIETEPGITEDTTQAITKALRFISHSH